MYSFWNLFLSRARVVYSYAAADTDEIDISESEVIEILNEGKFFLFVFLKVIIFLN